MKSEFIQVTGLTDSGITYVNPDHIIKFKEIQRTDDKECTEILMSNGVGLHVKESATTIWDRIDGLQEI